MFSKQLYFVIWIGEINFENIKETIVFSQFICVLNILINHITTFLEKITEF